MENLTAYCPPSRRRCGIFGPSLVVLKNGRKAVTGRAKVSHSTRSSAC